MPNNIAQWCWFTFFIFGTFGGWIFILSLILKMRSGEIYSRSDLEIDLQRERTVNRTLGTTLQRTMEDLRQADATIAAMKSDIEQMKGETNGEKDRVAES